jgi:hypothetical protein
LALLLSSLVAVFLFLRPAGRGVPTGNAAPGEALDTLHGVVVHANGGMGAVHGRHVVAGYNVGLRYQCVEFVKRYYLERFGHRMPDSYGHAKDFFDPAVADGGLNRSRGLLQFRNNGRSRPEVGDLLVLAGWRGNRFGHVAIISAVRDGEIEVVQQNTGHTRDRFRLKHRNGHWRVGHDRVLGWARMP